MKEKSIHNKKEKQNTTPLTQRRWLDERTTSWSNCARAKAGLINVDSDEKSLKAMTSTHCFSAAQDCKCVKNHVRTEVSWI